VEKNFRTPPHFGMTPPKSGGVLAKCGGVLKKLFARCARKIWTPHLQTRGDAHAWGPMGLRLQGQRSRGDMEHNVPHSL